MDCLRLGKMIVQLRCGLRRCWEPRRGCENWQQPPAEVTRPAAEMGISWSHGDRSLSQAPTIFGSIGVNKGLIMEESEYLFIMTLS